MTCLPLTPIGVRPLFLFGRVCVCLAAFSPFGELGCKKKAEELEQQRFSEETFPARDNLPGKLRERKGEGLRGVASPASIKNLLDI